MRQEAFLAIVGGGAAGFFAAAQLRALPAGKKVVLLEKTGKLLSKVRVSGGGRCNVTHHCFEPKPLATHYPRGQRFAQKAFHWFGAGHTVDWFAERGVALHTEADGRMFPSTNNSETIAHALLQAAQENGVDILLNAGVEKVETLAQGGFLLLLSGGREWWVENLLVASGGFPKLLQYDWLKGLGHTIVPPRPSLFTFNLPGHPITQLMGVAVPQALVKLVGTKQQQLGPLLITHWGLSGPAVLKLSAWAARELADLDYQFTAVVNWLGAETWNELQARWPLLRQQLNAQTIGQKNPFALPQRLWTFLLETAGLDPQTRWNSLPAAGQNQLMQLLTGQSFAVSGKTTFKEEFVTCGGIDTAEVDANTLQSKLHPGLYSAGEVLNVDGITGGFNFQHAWTSGYLAAKRIMAAI